MSAMSAPITLFGRTYEQLVADVAQKVAEALGQPSMISQRKAYATFGRGNVDRWRRSGRLRAFKRPGKVEYLLSDLRALQGQPQDYFSIDQS